MSLRPYSLLLCVLAILGQSAPLAAKKRAAETPKPRECPHGPLSLEGSQWNGWSPDKENARWQSDPGLSPAAVPQLQLKWAYAYSGPIAAGQPSLAGNRIFITNITGEVSALDAQSGCTQWTYQAGAAVRTAVLVAPAPLGVPAKFIAYFGDDHAFAHAVDAETGQVLWRTRLELHPAARIAGAPKLHDGRLFVPIASREEELARNPNYPCCTSRGALAALDASSGRVLWKSYTLDSTPQKKSTREVAHVAAGAAVWSSPTIDERLGLVYIATGRAFGEVETREHNAVMAFDMKTGARRWVVTPTPSDLPKTSKQTDKQPANKRESNRQESNNQFSAALILATLPNRKQLLIAGQQSGVVYALDPDRQGNIVWQTRVSAGSEVGGVQWGMAADDSQLYVAISDVLNRRNAMPGLTALRLIDGDKAWYVATPAASCSFTGGRCARGQSAAISVIPGAVFSGALDGNLRAYSTVDGSTLWSFNTGRTFKTLDGTEASGGNLDGGGAVIADGLVVANSGYDSWIGGYGKVMLVFGVN